MGKIKKTLISLGIWLSAQLTVTIIYAIVALILKKDFNSLMGQALLVSDFLAIVVFILIRFCKIKEIFQPAPAQMFLASMLLGISALFAVDILASPFDIPNFLEEQFKDMSKTFGGFLGICIIGPVMEEIMMRRIILTEMKQATGSMWLGIIISSAIFAVIHINPVQVIFAMPAGIVLGWIYCKTGSLLVPICIHIFNNTFSFITMRISAKPGMEDAMNIELNSPLGMYLTAILIMLAAGAAIWIQIYYSKKAKEQETTAVTEQ